MYVFLKLIINFVVSRAPEDIFKFSSECANSVSKAYLPIIAKHKDDPYTQVNIPPHAYTHMHTYTHTTYMIC